jgi:hypothetical protein
MNTPYGDLKISEIESYLNRLIGRIFKIIPLSEEGCETLEAYVDSLVREVLGNSKIFLGEELLCVSGTLKGLSFENHQALKSDIFKTINLIEKSIERVKKNGLDSL